MTEPEDEGEDCGHTNEADPQPEPVPASTGQDGDGRGERERQGRTEHHPEQVRVGAVVDASGRCAAGA